MARSPQLVLDGAVIAAELTGAAGAVIVVHRDVREIVDEAVAERRRAGLDRVRISVRTAAERFTAGEASAVVHWVERGVPTPTGRPTWQRGVHRAPTLVQNVETLAHLALIARYGAAWFRSAGTVAEPGSMLVTILGAVRRPRVAEVAIGTPVGQILELAGGASSPPRALLLGGYSGAWVTADEALRLAVLRRKPRGSRCRTRGWSDCGAARQRMRPEGNRPGDPLPGRRVGRTVRTVRVRAGLDRRPGRTAGRRHGRRSGHAAALARPGGRPGRVRTSRWCGPAGPQCAASLQRRTGRARGRLVLRHRTVVLPVPPGRSR